MEYPGESRAGEGCSYQQLPGGAVQLCATGKAPRLRKLRVERRQGRVCLRTIGADVEGVGEVSGQVEGPSEELEPSLNGAWSGVD